jgi:hypothetical protein
MVKAGDTLFVAGPADIVDEEGWQKRQLENPEQFAKQADLFTGNDGSLLWAVSADDGEKIREMKLDVAPVFDGMIAAGGQLIMSTVDGRVVCLGN